MLLSVYVHRKLAFHEAVLIIINFQVTTVCQLSRNPWSLFLDLISIALWTAD